jgi:hypothetical protein
MTLRHTHCIDTLNKVLLIKTGENYDNQRVNLAWRYINRAKAN